MVMLKLISLNVERRKHLDRVIPFLKREEPDVFCLQEVCEQDLSRLESETGASSIFALAGLHPADHLERGTLMVGTGLFARLPVTNASVSYYRGSGEAASTDTNRVLSNLACIIADIEKEDAIFKIGTLHFLWTRDGKPNTEQRESLAELLPILERAGELVLAGDFNAPRGGEIFNEFSRVGGSN